MMIAITRSALSSARAASKARGHSVRGLRRTQVTMLLLLPLLACAPGCGLMLGFFVHLVGMPEAAPELGSGLALPTTLGELAIAAPSLDGTFSGPGAASTAAAGATTADVAGVWVQGEGVAAVHINAAGGVYQIDIADEIDGEILPDAVPRTVFNAGRVEVQSDGTVPLDGGVVIGPVVASLVGTATLDATLNVMYDVFFELTYDIGLGERTATYYSPWYRWDATTGTYPALE